MRVNFNLRANRKKPGFLSDAIGLLVLAGELYVFLCLSPVQDWFLRTIPSQRAWIITWVVIYLGLAIWAFRIWPRFDKASDWLFWTVSFGVVGAFLLSLGISSKYGKRSAFVYGGCFFGMAMIGIAGLARLLWSNLLKAIVGTEKGKPSNSTQ